MADVTGIAPVPNYGENLETIPSAEAQQGLQLAQTGLTQAETTGQMNQNALQQMQLRFRAEQMQYAQSLIDKMQAGPVNDSGYGSHPLPQPGQGATGVPAGGATSYGLDTGTSPDTGAPAPAAAGGQLTEDQQGQPSTDYDKSDPLGSVGLDSGHLAKSALTQYGVLQYTPNEIQQLTSARQMDMMSAAAGVPTNYAGQVQAQIDMRVKNQTDLAAKASSQMYDTLTQGVYGAPDGSHLSALERSGPGGQATAQKLESLAKEYDWTPDQLDHAAANVALESANAIYRYTGRTPKDRGDGVMVDTDSGLPIAGSPQAGVNPNSAAMAASRAAGAGASLVDVPDGKGRTTQMPLYQALTNPQTGKPYASLGEYKQAIGLPPVAPAGTSQPPTVAGTAPPGAPAAPGTVPGTAAPAPTAAPRAAPRTAVPAGGSAPTGVPGVSSTGPAPTLPAPGTPQYQQLAATAKQYGAPDPQTFVQSLSDTSYRAQLPQAGPRQTLSPDELEARKDYIEKFQTPLQEDAQEEIIGASQSLQYLQAAQQILKSQGAPVTGLYGRVAAEISRVFPGGVDAANYQEVVKYLGNAALQNAKATYGARMTQNEVKLQLNDLSPSATMQPAAQSELIGKMSSIAQYTIDRGQRVRPYLSAGNDARYFDQWNQNYYPRQTIVNAPTTPAAGSGAAPAATPASSRPVPSAAAYARLQADPSLLPAFKARYGFAPAGM